jgi:uncharacterized protein
MSDPAKVLGFLDIVGKWDPSLALVMGGAVAVGLIAYAVAKRRQSSWLGLPMQIPTATHIDRRLVIGALLFGVGWGLAGICPGPALVLLGAGSAKGFVFFVAMVVGMGVFDVLQHLAKTPPPPKISPPPR